MKNTASKSTLFLIELVIAILFFAISSAVCVQIFAKAHIFSTETKQINYASSKINSFAAYIKTENGDFAAIAENLEGDFASEVANLYYDADWQATEKEKCVYMLTAKKVQGEQVHIEVYKSSTQEKILGQKVAYHLPITLEEAMKR